MIGPEALAPLVASALDYVRAGDNARAAVIVGEITTCGDGADIFGLCCAAAGSARDVFSAEEGPALLATIPTGDPHRLFAGQFLTAYLAGDLAMAHALFYAAYVAGERVCSKSVCALFALVSTLYRSAGTQEGPSHEQELHRITYLPAPSHRRGAAAGGRGSRPEVRRGGDAPGPVRRLWPVVRHYEAASRRGGSGAPLAWWVSTAHLRGRGWAVKRFLAGLFGGAAAGGVAYVIEPVRPWWWAVALIVAVLIWFGDLIVYGFTD